MTELEIAVAPMHRLCKKAGADRVSEAAAKELAKALEEIGVKIAKEALDFAMHAGRKTIKEHFTFEIMMDKIESYLCDAADHSPRIPSASLNS